MQRRPLSKPQAASLVARIETETLRMTSGANLRTGSRAPTAPARGRLPRADAPLTDAERDALPF